MNAINLKFGQYDTAPTQEFLLTRKRVVVDLTDAQVYFNLKSLTTGAVKIDNRLCAVTDAFGGKCQVTWQTGDFDTIGDFKGTIVIKYLDGRQESFRDIVITVEERPAL